MFCSECAILPCTLGCVLAEKTQWLEPFDLVGSSLSTIMRSLVFKFLAARWSVSCIFKLQRTVVFGFIGLRSYYERC